MSTPKYKFPHQRFWCGNKLSSYLTIVPHKNKYILAQGINGTILTIDRKVFDTLKGNLNRENPPLIENVKQILIKSSIIVPQNLDERKIIKELFENERKRQDAILNMTLALTLRCNFRCPYCYGFEKNIDMSQEVIDRALDNLFSEARQKNARQLAINFFGGEPLLFPSKIIYAVNRTREFCKKHNIKPYFGMVTNGSLFNKKNLGDLFEKEKELMVKIALDGTKGMHDRRRYFKNGKGSFDIIFGNLPFMLRSSREVIVRINIDKENHQNIPRLLQKLKKFKEHGNLKITFAGVSNRSGAGKKRDKTLSTEELLAVEGKLLKISRKLGLNAKGLLKTRHSIGRCIASFAKPAFIGPQGDIFVCQRLIWEKKAAIGNVFDGLDNEKLKKWKDYTPLHYKRCLNCKHVFFCGGPCPEKIFRAGFQATYFCDNFDKYLLMSI